MLLPEPSSLLLFMFASWALAVTPGSAVLYIVTRSINQGRTAGIVSVLGIASGDLVHILAAALGLSALLLSSVLAFNIVKYLGAAYLIYLGICQLCDRSHLQFTATLRTASLKRIFLQGFIVNALNPKPALFFMAFLPQFIDPAKGSVALQAILLGCIFTGVASCSDGMYALVAGTIGQWLKRSTKFLRFQKYFAGSTYMGLGVTTALSGAPSK
ncbi:MAG: LysE family translocator [Drouetiella hepatica Uher 2000/2452]|uniref:LysE family translocator n=1 Tax=Drouetiella hepatica Uher 2000/2452 TaxID=904376 RepID=A0A951Q9P5_9CYAN|nr:LysE family translocator [Drouetiella hepatica Uher 2000/2452]